jgi:CheY-like chemotaxis protein
MILVIASHAPTRLSLVSLIASSGYAAQAADCDDDVLQRLTFRKALAVVLDCGLADSFELLARIRAEPRAAATPVVMFSIDDENVREKAMLRGADAYVPRGSLDWADLLAEVQRFAGPPSEN